MGFEPIAKELGVGSIVEYLVDWLVVPIVVEWTGLGFGGIFGIDNIDQQGRQRIGELLLEYFG